MATGHKDLQEALMMCGYYPGTVDGMMGPNTKKAIKKFQEDNGLDADGIAGANTKAKLSEKLGSAMARATELMAAFAADQG